MTPCPFCRRKRCDDNERHRLATAMWWLGRAIHRLAGLDPWPGDTRRN